MIDLDFIGQYAEYVAKLFLLAAVPTVVYGTVVAIIRRFMPR